MKDDPPVLDRAFAILLADEIKPHLKGAFDDAVSEYMGSNGEQHRIDHNVLLPELEAFLDQHKKEQEAREAAAKKEIEERTKFRREVMRGVTIGVILLVLNILARLFGW